MAYDLTQRAFENLRQKGIGKCIKEIALNEYEDTLVIYFTNGDLFTFVDDAQTCCEKRYMVCDDDLSKFKGAFYEGWRLESGPSEEIGNGPFHDVQFLIIDTSAGSITIANHNEHNGYYRGFYVVGQYKTAQNNRPS